MLGWTGPDWTGLGWTGVRLDWGSAGLGLRRQPAFTVTVTTVVAAIFPVAASVPVTVTV